MCDSENNTVETFMLPPEHDALYGTAYGDKKEPFKPAGGDDLVCFVKDHIHKLTTDEMKNRESKAEYTILRPRDVYPVYIKDVPERGYCYIPYNDFFRHALAYAMAKVYGVVEKCNSYDLFMEGYEGFVLCDDLVKK